MPTYYRIKDKALIGRQDDMFTCSIYHKGEGWVPDRESVLMDRIIGYDGDGIGATDMMDQLEEISEAEALAAIE